MSLSSICDSTLTYIFEVDKKREIFKSKESALEEMKEHFSEFRRDAASENVTNENVTNDNGWLNHQTNELIHSWGNQDEQLRDEFIHALGEFLVAEKQQTRLSGSLYKICVTVGVIAMGVLIVSVAKLRS